MPASTTIQVAARVITIIACVLPIHKVLADTAGPNSPTAASTAQIPNSSGTWANPDNALASDDSYATQPLFGGSTINTNLLWVRGFNFTIPAGATINGIAVSVERNSQCDDTTPPCTSEIRDRSVVLWRDGFFNTEDKAKPDAWPENDATVGYGGTADLWGQSWTPALINNAGFGVGISARLSDSIDGRTARVDYVSITITYTPAVGAKADTTTSVTCATPVTLGSSSSCTATVTRASGTNTPSGNVNWGTTDSGHSSTFGASACTPGAEALTCTVSFTPSEVDTPTIQAVYPGDANFNGSSGQTSVTVVEPPQPPTSSTSIPTMGSLGLLLSGLGFGLLGAWRVRRKH